VWSASIDGLPVGGLTIGGDVLYVGLLKQSGSQSNGRFLAFDARGCGSAACSRIADVDFGDRQPLQSAVAGGRVAVVAVSLDAATLRVLVPGS
jgi:hypothetical protein